MYEERVEAADIQQRWEYLCQRIGNPENLEFELNRMGEERWELVNVAVVDGELTAIYKSPTKLFSPRKKPAKQTGEMAGEQTGERSVSVRFPPIDRHA